MCVSEGVSMRERERKEVRENLMFSHSIYEALGWKRRTLTIESAFNTSGISSLLL